ncbi:MAG: hypothetical protein ABR582_01580 [Gemmatimonadaceae bacterium]
MRITLLTIHIIAGTIGIITGFIALFAVKGATLHRKVGIVFVVAMLTMAIFGATIAAAFNAAPEINVPVGLLTAYLVVTSLVTVRPPASGSSRLSVGLMLLAMALSLTLIFTGVNMLAGPLAKFAGVFFIFALIALLATAGDIRMLRSGPLHGRFRLARHLWRMSTALLIAAFSFFIGQAKVIPKPIRIIPLLLVPPLVVLVTMLYWLWRVRFKKSRRGSRATRSLKRGSAMHTRHAGQSRSATHLRPS